MALAVRMQRITGFGDGSLQPDRGQRVLQRAALALVHVHVAGGGDGQAERFGDEGELFATRRVVGLEQALGGDPQAAAKARHQPARFVRIGLVCGKPQREAAVDAVAEIGAGQPIAALHRAASAAGDERREAAVAFAIGGQQYQAQSVVETKLAADDERQAALFGFDMRAHDAGERTFIGDRQRLVAQLVRPRDQLLGVRRTAQEGEIGNTVQLGVGHVHSRKHALHEPLPSAIAVEPHFGALRIAADEIIAADFALVPPSGFDALGAG